MSTASETLAVVDDERFDGHRSRDFHPERPERLDAARSAVARVRERNDWLRVDTRPASDEEIAAVHTSGYAHALERKLDGFGHIDADTFYSPETREAAWLAAGGAAELARTLMQDRVRRGIALLRPPGHHAEADRAMGFCLLNNVAIAARAAQHAGAERVAIVDWDVHHGNGTQHAFENDRDVLFVSLHQWPLWPGTGAPDEVGRGDAIGTTANLALAPGSGDEVYAEAFRRVVLPLIRAHRPDIVLVSAGYDAHARDPLASMELSDHAYGAMASALVEEAEALGHGRVAFFLEGGYDLNALEASVAATVRGALGERVSLPEEKISARARASIETTRQALERARGDRLDG
jgi:acetoin utilization deacetylase AcuC-like enzyme